MATLYKEIEFACRYITTGMDCYKGQCKKFLLHCKKFFQKQQKLYKRSVKNLYIRSFFYDVQTEKMVIYTKYQDVPNTLECVKIGTQVMVKPQWRIPDSAIVFIQKNLNYYIPTGSEDECSVCVMPDWRRILHEFL